MKGGGGVDGGGDGGDGGDSGGGGDGGGGDGVAVMVGQGARRAHPELIHPAT